MNQSDNNAENSSEQNSPVPSAQGTGSANTGRRSRRRFWLAAAVAGALGVGAVSACSHSGRGWHGAGDDPSARIEFMVDKVFSRVDASTEQKAEITKIARAAYQDLAPMRTEWKASRKAALDLLTSETIDRQAIETMRTQHLTRFDTASTRASSALADIAEVLTPAQRMQVREKVASRMGKHKHRGWGRWHRGS